MGGLQHGCPCGGKQLGARAHERARALHHVLLVRHLGRAQDGAAQRHLCAGPYRDGQALAQRHGRWRPALHHRGHGLGQGRMGQVLRVLDHGDGRPHLRLRSLPRGRDPRPHPALPRDHAVLPAHDVSPHEADGLRHARPLVAQVLHDGGRGAQPRPLLLLAGTHGALHLRGLRPDRDAPHRRQPQQLHAAPRLHGEGRAAV